MSATPPQPHDPNTDKTIVRRRASPDDTTVHRPAGPPKSDAPRLIGGLRPDQVRYLAIAWIALTCIAGICGFVGIYAFTSGQGISFTDATPVGQVPTATNTPFPTLALPTEIPPTPGPATESPDTGGGGLPPIGTFNLGGQSVHGGFPGADRMHQAGMTWAKLQSFDMTTDFGPAIVNAHNLGFRILISVVDKANKDRVTDPAYQQQYVSYLANLAALGADAIEVWNEENIDREWPTGQINATSYAQLLAAAYGQIKAANPETLVISGALSPTGFFNGGCTAQGCDDKPYLEAMVAAGALNYADCVGIHYNEGILSPTQTGGDPRGNPNHYTRYYQSMVDTYWTAAQGQKPLCFTELGYLTDEGYEDLSAVAPGFAWAANTTISQQAQWLGEAVTLAKQSNGQVKLLIVFNVDYTTYGVDPQAGYAIIRKDGSCPACETLARVMGQ